MARHATATEGEREKEREARANEANETVDRRTWNVAPDTWGTAASAGGSDGPRSTAAAPSSRAHSVGVRIVGGGGGGARAARPVRSGRCAADVGRRMASADAGSTRVDRWGTVVGATSTVGGGGGGGRVPAVWVAGVVVVGRVVVVVAFARVAQEEGGRHYGWRW